MSSPTQAHRFLKISSRLGEDAILPVRANGVEALGRLFEIELEFTAARDDLDPGDLLGTPATLRIDMSAARSRSARANVRHFNGHFSRIVHGGFQREGRPIFRATLVPWLWFLTRRADSRIFQQKTVREILEQVFSDAGFADYQFDLKGSYPMVDYCVQYRETDFQFVSRLMEREGIYYHFHHKNGSHKMVICDDMACHVPEKNFETLSLIGGSSLADKEGVVLDWEFSRELKPGAFAHNDFNFLTPTPDPNLRLLSRATAPNSQRIKGFEIYEPAGGFPDAEEGSRYARIRMQELLADGQVATARTNIQGVCAGRKFKLARHPTKSQNRGYLVTSVQWSVHEGGYGSGGGGEGEFFACAFTCIPDDCVYRPSRTTPVPRIEGPQTATVVGPKGEEIHVDPHARVKVQFHWDRHGKMNESSSCWIRVSQPWAGGVFGGIAIPRIGHEVVVDFIEGDPDRPIIIGRVYNASNPPHPSDAGRAPNAARAARDEAVERKKQREIERKKQIEAAGHE
jgi:type VI secretion system secreted protein VgrG